LAKFCGSNLASINNLAIRAGQIRADKVSSLKFSRWYLILQMVDYTLLNLHLFLEMKEIVFCGINFCERQLKKIFVDIIFV